MATGGNPVIGSLFDQAGSDTWAGIQSGRILPLHTQSELRTSSPKQRGTYVGTGRIQDYEGRNLPGFYGIFGAIWRTLLLLERRLQQGVFQMDGIFVEATACGQGIGTALLTAIKDETRRTGMREVQLDVIRYQPPCPKPLRTRGVPHNIRRGCRTISAHLPLWQGNARFGKATRMSWLLG